MLDTMSELLIEVGQSDCAHGFRIVDGTVVGIILVVVVDTIDHTIILVVVNTIDRTIILVVLNTVDHTIIPVVEHAVRAVVHTVVHAVVVRPNPRSHVNMVADKDDMMVIVDGIFSFDLHLSLDRRGLRSVWSRRLLCL